MSFDATNLPNNGLPEPINDSRTDVREDQSSNNNALSELTDQNWLFIKHFLETSDIKKAYQLAGYTGTAKSAPYDIFKRLKPFIEELVNTELTSKLKFDQSLQKALSIPLVDKEHLTVSEWLRLRKFASSLVPEMQENKQKLSVLVVNRYGDQSKVDTVNVEKGTNSTHQPTSKDVILDATIIPSSNEEAKG